MKSPFLSLPIELRYYIYDFVLLHLLIDPKHHNSYVLPNEWPVKSFVDYSALLLTCKQTNVEAEHHFTTKYASNITLYFNNIHVLRQLSQKLSLLAPQHALQRIKFSLRLENVGGVTDDLSSPESPRQLQGFMISQGSKGLTETAAQSLHACFVNRFGLMAGIDEHIIHDDALRMRSRIDIVRIPAMRSSTLEVTTRQIATCAYKSQYDELTGDVRELEWVEETTTEKLRRHIFRSGDKSNIRQQRANKHSLVLLQHLLEQCGFPPD